jgi:hypothetical protein
MRLMENQEVPPLGVVRTYAFDGNRKVSTSGELLPSTSATAPQRVSGQLRLKG